MKKLPRFLFWCSALIWLNVFEKEAKVTLFLLIRHQQTWVAGVYSARYHAEFVGAIYIGYPTKMTVKLKEHLQMREYCSYY